MTTTPDVASFLPQLKEDYKDEINQLAESCGFLAQLEQDNDSVVGEHARYALHTRRSPAVGSSDGSLPQAGRQGYEMLIIPVRRHYARVQFPEWLQAAMATQKGSFAVDGMASEMSHVVSDFRRRMNRQSWGTADGVIAVCGTTSNSTTVVLAADTTETQMQQLTGDGQAIRIDIGTVASPKLKASYVEILDFDDTPGAMTITISGSAITTSGSHRIFAAVSPLVSEGGASNGNGRMDDGQHVLTGVQSAVDNGDLYNITASDVPVYTSRVIGADGDDRAWSEAVLNRAINTANKQSDLSIDLLLCNSNIFEEAVNDQRAQRRNVDTIALKGGVEGIVWGSVGQFNADTSQDPDAAADRQRVLGWERDCPNNRVYGIASESVKLLQMGGGPNWANPDGNVQSRVPNADETEAYFRWYSELAWTRRNCNFVVKGLRESTIA